MYYKIIFIGKFGLLNKLVVWEIKIVFVSVNKYEVELRKMNVWLMIIMVDIVEINM